MPVRVCVCCLLRACHARRAAADRQTDRHLHQGGREEGRRGSTRGEKGKEAVIVTTRLLNIITEFAALFVVMEQVCCSLSLP